MCEYYNRVSVARGRIDSHKRSSDGTEYSRTLWLSKTTTTNKTPKYIYKQMKRKSDIPPYSRSCAEIHDKDVSSKSTWFAKEKSPESSISNILRAFEVTNKISLSPHESSGVYDRMRIEVSGWLVTKK